MGVHRPVLVRLAGIAATDVVSHPRLRGRGDGVRLHRVDFRHVIHAPAASRRRDTTVSIAHVRMAGAPPKSTAIQSAVITR